MVVINVRFRLILKVLQSLITTDLIYLMCQKMFYPYLKINNQYPKQSKKAKSGAA